MIGFIFWSVWWAAGVLCWMYNMPAEVLWLWAACGLAVAWWADEADQMRWRQEEAWRLVIVIGLMLAAGTALAKPQIEEEPPSQTRQIAGMLAADFIAIVRQKMPRRLTHFVRRRIGEKYVYAIEMEGPVTVYFETPVDAPAAETLAGLDVAAAKIRASLAARHLPSEY